MKRINFIALLVFLAAVVWVFTWKSPTAQALQTRVVSLFSPFIRTGATVQEKVEEMRRPEVSPGELLAENVKLTDEVARLRIYSDEYQKVKAENEELRGMLNFAKTSPLKLIPARILTRNSATWWRTAIIDRGANQGVRVDTTVRTAEGLIGRVTNVEPEVATILFITDETCLVAVKIEGSPDQGILSGVRGIAGRNPELRISYLPRDASLQPGAKVYTSGKGRLYKSGILVGEIVSFGRKDDGGEAIVKPAVDFDRIKHVFVVVDSEGDEPFSTPAKAPETRAP